MSVEASDKAGKRGDSLLVVLGTVGICTIAGLLIAGIL